MLDRVCGMIMVQSADRVGLGIETLGHVVQSSFRGVLCD
jgi:hypothetical protein